MVVALQHIKRLKLGFSWVVCASGLGTRAPSHVSHPRRSQGDMVYTTKKQILVQRFARKKLVPQQALSDFRNRSAAASRKGQPVRARR